MGAAGGIWAGPPGIAVGVVVGGLLGALLADHAYVQAVGVSQAGVRPLLQRFTGLWSGVDEAGLALALVREHRMNLSFVRDVFRSLLAAELNRRMEELLHGDTRWFAGPAATLPVPAEVNGGITSEDEEKQLEVLSAWMEAQGLPRGTLAYDFADAATGEQKAVFDLAWPHGIQEELSQPVAVLLNESTEMLGIASQAGYRCFTAPEDFRRYVNNEILVQDGA